MSIYSYCRRAQLLAAPVADLEGKVQTRAVILEHPGCVGLGVVELKTPAQGDVIVDVHFSGISTGTERLLWEGRMPDFPGMGYPLVPGYEAVGEVVDVVGDTVRKPGDFVFVPGAKCFPHVRSLFGASAQRLAVDGTRTIAIDRQTQEQGVTLALAATAYHALIGGHSPELIIGHGVLGRLLARLALIFGAEPPTVWETNSSRRSGHFDYSVVHPQQDARRDYAAIYDASGDVTLIDDLVGRLERGGEIVLTGFYPDRVSFAFAPAFMREARLRIASEWQPADLEAVAELVAEGRLSLDGLVSDITPADKISSAYGAAFQTDHCLKMALDWSSLK